MRGRRGEQYRIRRLGPKIGKPIGEIFGNHPEPKPQQADTAEPSAEHDAASP